MSDDIVFNLPPLPPDALTGERFRLSHTALTHLVREVLESESELRGWNASRVAEAVVRALKEVEALR